LRSSVAHAPPRPLNGITLSGMNLRVSVRDALSLWRGAASLSRGAIDLSRGAPWLWRGAIYLSRGAPSL
jgi:hypothetical protein